MSGSQRTVAAALILLAVLTGLGLLVFAGNACPADTELRPCPDAARNLAIAIALASVTVGLLVAPFAFLAEHLARRRIVYRGAWARAARRGLLAGASVAVLAALRLAGVLSVPVALFVVILAGAIEWFSIRSDR